MTKAVKLSKQTIVTMRVPVVTTQADINDGECGLTNRCMEKLAVTRALIEHLSLPAEQVSKLHVKVDGARIRFNYDGYRWEAKTPNIARTSLIVFDDPKRGKQHVKPHRYMLTAVRASKVIPFTRERQDQINRARQRRVAEGKPDRVYKNPTIHQRVVGLAQGNG